MTTIGSAEQLRKLYRAPGKLPRLKVLDHLDAHCRAFIASSPFLVIATHDAEGRCDASPRGDAPGFVEVLDDHRLLLPDKPGNNRIDSLLNIIERPGIGMLFMIPGIPETLRLNGRATITTDPDLLEAHRERGKLPLSGLVVRVEEVFLHCSRSLLAAGIWKPETWLKPKETSLPSPTRIWADHVAIMKSREK